MERIGQIIKAFENKGYITGKEAFVLRGRAIRDIQELGDSLLLSVLTSSSKSSSPNLPQIGPQA